MMQLSLNLVHMLLRTVDGIWNSLERPAFLSPLPLNGFIALVFPGIYASAVAHTTLK